MASDLYFAYGSNLTSVRLRGRAPTASARGAARLRGFALRFDKRGADGSGKANLWPQPDAEVWGAVYALDADDWSGLDAAEPGYERIRVRVELADASVEVWTYRSELRLDEPLPLASYHRLVVEGAREHGLPREWIAWLEALRVRD